MNRCVVRRRSLAATDLGAPKRLGVPSASRTQRRQALCLRDATNRMMSARELEPSFWPM